MEGKTQTLHIFKIKNFPKKPVPFQNAHDKHHNCLIFFPENLYSFFLPALHFSSIDFKAFYRRKTIYHWVTKFTWLVPVKCTESRKEPRTAPCPTPGPSHRVTQPTLYSFLHPVRVWKSSTKYKRLWKSSKWEYLPRSYC